LALVQKLNLPAEAEALAAKTALETVFPVGQAAVVDPLVLAQQSAVLRRHPVKATLVVALQLEPFLAAVVVLVRRGRQERSPLLVAVETATLIR